MITYADEIINGWNKTWNEMIDYCVENNLSHQQMSDMLVEYNHQKHLFHLSLINRTHPEVVTLTPEAVSTMFDYYVMEMRSKTIKY